MVLHRSPVLDSGIAAEYSPHPHMLTGCLIGVRFIAGSLGCSGEDRTFLAIKGSWSIWYSLGGAFPNDTNTKEIQKNGI